MSQKVFGEHWGGGGGGRIMPCTLDFVNLLKSNLACDRAFYILSKIKRISFVNQCANEFYDVILFSRALKDIEIQTTVKSSFSNLLL